ncbi:MAG: hypothetical protein R2851_18125 [Caldilineaceae bacterium]
MNDSATKAVMSPVVPAFTSSMIAHNSLWISSDRTRTDSIIVLSPGVGGIQPDLGAHAQPAFGGQKPACQKPHAATRCRWHLASVTTISLAAVVLIDDDADGKAIRNAISPNIPPATVLVMRLSLLSGLRFWSQISSRKPISTAIRRMTTIARKMPQIEVDQC